MVMSRKAFVWTRLFGRWVILLAVILGLVLPPMQGYAAPKMEESNRNEVRRNLAKNGWTVIYGDLINEGDYAEFGAAVATAIATENPSPIYAFFNSQLNAQFTKIRRTAPDILQASLNDLIVQAFKTQGRVLRKGNLEVSGGLATYNRWKRVVYHEPHTYRCKLQLPLGGWTWSICTTTKKVEKSVPLPNNFQPYIRYRWRTVSTKPKPVTPSRTPYAVVCLVNRTNRTINYSYRWGTGAWKSRTISAKRSRYHSWKYAAGSHSSPDFRIRFDADFSKGTDYKQYKLKRFRASEKKCSAGKKYEFRNAGRTRVGLYASK